LLRLQPRQRHTVPPRVDRIVPPAAGRAGQLVIERTMQASGDMRELENYAAMQFRQIREYFAWVNDDLDYFEQSTRNWLWTLIETRRRRIASSNLSTF
ncbi:MAG: hypothetical protein RRA94_14620, partial [Bacteroidota bacterium]|nr:hypothetical protein [Bacteroidota bacterium]